eukprot:CAMPEP_0118640748 /NCGR_PEP_ID=MMETSP0785-20121206/4916_1 /TAXON_ID=91992 /ORGANISM="Bolidomonas pacifica, Strain CCMP 1866" /LENGTH=38 /DNA_ID= /DNA_START= /DNA_END= /DNA_ORIENTATION=
MEAGRAKPLTIMYEKAGAYIVDVWGTPKPRRMFLELKR